MEKYSRNLVEMCFFFFSVQVRYWCYLLPFIVTYLLSETASLYSLSFKAVCCCVIRHVFERPGKDKKKKKPQKNNSSRCLGQSRVFRPFIQTLDRRAEPRPR